MSRFLDELRNGLMLGDGAVGTLLHQRGEPLDGCYDAYNLEKPAVVARVHSDYLAAGARLIEANTFGANRVKLRKFGREPQVREINEAGARLAVDLARPAGAFVAGSVGPITPDPSLTIEPQGQSEIYLEQFQGLAAGGVDLFFLETFNHLTELILALKAAKGVSGLPVIASLSFSDDGHTADGFRVNEAFRQLRAAGADVVGLNCHMGPGGIEKLLREMELRAGDLVSAYPNAGRPQFYEGRHIYHPTPQYFADYVPKLVAQGARLIGGCCGTTPETIRAMCEAMRGRRPVSVKPGWPVLEVPLSAKTPPTEGQSLLDVYQQKALIVTELDPPKNLQMDKMLEGARALKEAGTDFVTLADNSLAILRLSNMASAHLIRQKTGLEPVLHLACRDRNLLGLQSELMGLHALGLHHVLALTGDPAKMGDHPGATSVYDVNSIGLIKTVKRLNEGFAANGRDLKGKTQFVIGCAFNPNARNLDSQCKKLEDKLKAGAQFVMTQPMFDLSLIKTTRDRTQGFGVPVLAGVMPLLNSRNAEFLHNEVPGILIPDSIRERLRGKEGPSGNNEGLAIARDFCQEVLEHFKGIYLITPLMRFDLTADLSRFIREKVGKGLLA